MGESRIELMLFGAVAPRFKEVLSIKINKSDLPLKPRLHWEENRDSSGKKGSLNRSTCSNTPFVFPRQIL